MNCEFSVLIQIVVIIIRLNKVLTTNSLDRQQQQQKQKFILYLLNLDP